MPNPFDLADQDAYQAWRTRKLASYPARPADLFVELGQLARPTSGERAEVRARIAAFNMALVRVDPGTLEPQSLLDLGRAMGLARTDSNRFADAGAVSHITRSEQAPLPAAHLEDRRGDYIPYTDRPLSWHTDGYYNQADRQVGAWTLFCKRPARSGGESALLDHEIAYILLRDESPHHIEALSHPQALTIPANERDGAAARPASQGPVFSVRSGRLHMRYTARTRHVEWRQTPATLAARAAIERLFSAGNDFTFCFRMESGEGLIANNVLHNRSGFKEEGDLFRKRLLYRVRYLDRVEP